ncbi:MAG: AlkA N-terminal domain-containing protein [Acidimicrobiales bacterium]
MLLRDRPDDEVCYRALRARDRRFDGWFFVGVTSTSIYCRPSCPSMMPKREHVRFFHTAAAAQRCGFRACKRCRPDASPGSPEWNRRGDVVARAVQLIHDGVVDREGVHGLARRLGYSTRQLQRLLVTELGAGPIELARAQRADTARILLEATPLKMGEVAFAAGFGSIRQFNDTIKLLYGEPPAALRKRGASRACSLAQPVAGSNGSNGSKDSVALGTCAIVSLRLSYRSPFPLGPLFSFLSERAVPGVEEGDKSFYRRSLRLPRGSGIVTVRDGGAAGLTCELRLADLRDLTTAVARVRHMFDLDSDPFSVAEALDQAPVIGPAVRARPGLRLPGHPDGSELAVRAMLGQQVSVAGARTIAGRLTAQHGTPVDLQLGTVGRHFPSADAIAGLSPGELSMPAARARAVIGLCEALAGGGLCLDPGTDRDAVSSVLLKMPGIGPWTVAYIRMRALGDPDAFLASDLGVRRALESLGHPGGEKQALALGEHWRPYRAYALQYLWSSLGSGAGSGAGSGSGPGRNDVKEGTHETSPSPQRT